MREQNCAGIYFYVSTGSSLYLAKLYLITGQTMHFARIKLCH